jgi:hypothetical protein
MTMRASTTVCGETHPMTGRWFRRTTAICAGLVLLAACGADPSPSTSSASSTPSPQPTSSTSSVTALPTGGSSSPRPTRTHRATQTGTSTPSSTPDAQGSAAVTKLLVFVVENHSLEQMSTGMPYTFSLAEQYGYATSYRALTHPSLGNYLALAGGSTFGVTDDDSPPSHPIAGPSVFSAALAAGRTAVTYAEGMPGTCALENGGDRYAVRHNPWTYFVQDRADCARFDVPLDRFSGDVASGRLPNVGLVVPDLCNDAHDCALGSADAWLRDHLEPIFDGPDWRAGRLAVVITADEDDHHQDNLVLTTVLHPDLHTTVVDDPLTHLSLSRSYAEVAGVPALREAASAPSLLQAFGLRVP